MAIKLNLDFEISAIKEDVFSNRNLSVTLLRLDQIHPIVSGNKWFKLNEYIAKYQQSNYKGIITFGGAYSNHLVATAAACQYYQIPCIGIVRGLDAESHPSPSLQACTTMGMQLKFVSRTDYKKEKNQGIFLSKIVSDFFDYLIIQEGGYGELGIAGAQQICNFISDEYDTICLPIGSGTTFCGIVNGSKAHQQIIGFPAIKQGAYLNEIIAKNTLQKNWHLETAYHFGGFGKHKPELIQFIQQFKAKHNIELDFVYTAKMMLGLLHCIERQNWKHKKILCLHTGGLQGNSSIQNLLS